MAESRDNQSSARPRASLGWARPSGDRRWHSIALIVFGGSVHTRCIGRWPASDQYEHCGSPPEEERCACCQERLIEAMQIERGLRELVVNTEGQP